MIEIEREKETPEDTTNVDKIQFQNQSNLQ